MRLMEPCDSMAGPVKGVCEDDRGSGSGGSGGGNSTDLTDPTTAADPLGAFAHSCAKAAAWVTKKLGESIGEGPGVDLTNPEFLRQYAIVFAAATILVLVVWLLAVTKRTLRGVSFTTAISEAIGLLWLAVGATAFTPLILTTVIGATHAVTTVIVKASGGQDGDLFTSLGKTLTEGKLGGGPIVLIIASFATILLCGALLLLLVLRALGLYVGAILGIVVYAGVVDKDLWGHVRRWAGVMLALILMEPVIMIVLGLAAVLQTEGSIATGLAVTVLALGVALSLISKAPGAGDAIKAARTATRAAGGAGRAVVGSGGAAAGVMHGIHTHGDRSGGGRPSSPSSTGGGGSSASSSGGGVSGGISAHGQRRSTGSGGDSTATPKKPLRQKNSD